MQTHLNPHRSIRHLRTALSVLALSALFLAPLPANADTLAVTIKCSPATVVVDAIRSGDCLTVHTDLRFRDVDTTLPVMLNTVEAYAAFPDNRGNLVAKFKMAAMESLLAAPTTSLTLTGYTWGGAGFSGTDSVRVIE